MASTERGDPTDVLLAALEARGAAEPVVDGRRLRAERGRQTVVTTALALVDAGNPVPTFAEIAEASGVSERTIFRYFPDREALVGAVATEALPRFADCLVLNPPPGDLEVRAAALVRLRLELADHAAPLARSVERLAPTNELGALLLSLRVERLQEQVRTWFASELEACSPGTAALVDVLLSMASISHLRELLDADRLQPELTAAVVRLLDDA